MITAVVDSLMDDFEGPSVDLVSRFAALLPILVICSMLGVPTEERHEFVDIGHATARTVDPDVAIEDRLAANQLLRDYIATLIDRRRERPGDDLITGLIEAAEDGRLASTDELLANTGVFLVAGFETTTNLITNAVYQLLRHPDRLAELRRHPSLIRTTVEEVLRFDPPVHMMRPRTISSETQIGGAELHPGDPVVPLLAAANRDADEFDDPETFDIRRTPNRHLGFGLGPHLCVGAPLARLETQIALLALFDRFPNLALTDDTPEFRPNFTLRGFSKLLISL